MAHKVTVEIVADPRRLNAGLKESSASINNFVRGMERTSRGALAGTVAISGMGRAIAFASAQFLGGYGLLYALTATVKSAVEFQQSMTLIQTQAGGTAAEVQKMTKAVLLLAPSVGTTPDELAKGLYHIESSGIRGARAMETLKVAAQGAKLGSADLQQVVNGLVGAEISGIKGTQDLASTMGILDAIIGTGNLRMEEFSKALSSGIVPVARVFGLSLKDIGAALSTLTVHGIPAVMSANRLRTSLTFLAAGTPAAEKALSNIGLTTYKVGQMMRHQGLIPALEMISEHLRRSGLDATEQVQVISRAFGGARAGSTVIILLKYLEQLREHLDAISVGATTFAEKWEAEQKTAKFATDKLRASVSTMADMIGLALLPTVSRAANAISIWLSKSQNQERIQRDLTRAAKDTRMVLEILYKTIRGMTDAVGGLENAVKILIGYKVAKTILAWGDAALISAASFTTLATAEKEAGIAAGVAGAAGGAAGGSAAAKGAGAAAGAGVAEAAVAGAATGAAVGAASRAASRVRMNPAYTARDAAAGAAEAAKLAETAGKLGKIAILGAAARKSLVGMSEALAKFSLRKVFTVLIVAQILESFVSQSTKDKGQQALDDFDNSTYGSAVDPMHGVSKLGHLPLLGGLIKASAGEGNRFGEFLFGKPKNNKFFVSKEAQENALKDPGYQHDKFGYRIPGGRTDWYANISPQDRMNPRANVPGSGAHFVSQGLNLHADYYKADRASQLQLQLDQARLQVAKGNTAANQMVVAVLRKQIAMDEVAYKAQEKALKQGKGSAEKHTKLMSKLLQDEERLFGEIAATKQQTEKKSWELPMALQISQAWAANSDAISGDNTASTSVARQIAALVSKQIKSGKLKGQDLLSAISALTSAQQQIAQFNVPMKLQIQQAWAATTAGVGDDIAVASKLRDLIKAQIKAGKLRGAALLSALGQLAGAEATVRNNFNVPMKLQLAAAKASTTTITTDDRKAAQGIKDFALAYLKSKKKTAEGMLAAYQAITGANQTLGQTGQATAYMMASTHKLTAGLGLSRQQRIAQEQRIAQTEAHGGRIPRKGFMGVMGFVENGNPKMPTGPESGGAGPGATPPPPAHGIRPQTAPHVKVHSTRATQSAKSMVVHTPTMTVHAAKIVGTGGGGSVIINIHGGDPKEVERAVLKALQKSRRHSAPQRRGQHGGHTLGID